MMIKSSFFLNISFFLQVFQFFFSSQKYAFTNGCTVFIAGRDATSDGSVLVSHSNDGEFDTDPRLVKVSAADHPPDTQRPIFFSPESYPRYVGYHREVPEYFPRRNPETHQFEDSFEPIGFIPQVSHTFAYLEDTYGAVNEKQVGIGESTCSGVFGAIPKGAPNGTALLSVDILTQIAMERSSSAREAVSLMGTLAEEYGFYGAGEFEGTAESLGVTDTESAWIFHILPDPTGTSAIWAAQRIADDSFSVLANMFVIRQVDPDDSDNFLMSDSVHSVAKDYGWWKSKEEDSLLDFTKIYSDGEYAHKYYSGRRMWGGYHLACESLNFPSEYTDLQADPVYPVYAKPDSLLSQSDLFRFHRYTYQGTDFDLGGSKNLAAGPFGSPDRWKEGPNEAKVGGNWERSIGLYRTSDTYIVQSRSISSTSTSTGTGTGTNTSTNTGAVLWFGPASPLGTVFTPFIVNMFEVPASFRSGHQAVFDRKSAFWASCYVQNIANLKYSYAIQEITTRQNELEQASIAMIARVDESLRMNHDYDWKEVNDEYQSNIETIVSSLWSLSDEIMFKYASGFVNEAPDKMSEIVGYPEWWLEAVGYKDGPPPPPTKPKCCNPQGVDGDGADADADVLSEDHQSLRKREVGWDGDGDGNNLPIYPSYNTHTSTGKAAMKEYLKLQAQSTQIHSEVN